MSFGLDLDLLKTYAAVVDSGGFTKAAERVHLTQSTVSQQIKKLGTCPRIDFSSADPLSA